jgi:hypothetical protein
MSSSEIPNLKPENELQDKSLVATRRCPISPPCCEAAEHAIPMDFGTSLRGFYNPQHHRQVNGELSLGVWTPSFRMISRFLRYERIFLCNDGANSLRLALASPSGNDLYRGIDKRTSFGVCSKDSKAYGTANTPPVLEMPQSKRISFGVSWSPGPLKCEFETSITLKTVLVQF